MIVIKLGGSLVTADTLLYCLNRIEQQYQNQKVVLVTGGGGLADYVRDLQQHWQFNDECAHAMAILAMQQMAWLIKGLKADVELVHSVNAILQSPPKILMWLPDVNELNNAGIPATWDITSDSLAAWLANALSADELILIKSAVIDSALNLAQLAERGIIDNAFCERVVNSRFNIRVINHQNV